MMLRIIAACLILGLLFSAPGRADDTTEIKATEPPKDKVPISLLELGEGEHALVVDKKTRTVSVWGEKAGNLQLLQYYAADIGKNHGNKKSVGDYKTPEGIYFLESMQNGRELDYKLYGERIFKTDYPNYFDRSEGKTGYGIWLHAVPDTVPLTRGSKGCVVVRNGTILDLTQFIKLRRTPMLIHDQVEYVSADQRFIQNKKTLDWLEKWRSAWARKDIENYIKFYSGDFKSLGMNQAQWKIFKAGLNEKYASIDVRVQQPVVYQHGPKMIVRFFQTYQSDQHSDFGEKTLYLREEAGDFKILGEEWRKAPEGVAQQMAAQNR